MSAPADLKNHLKKIEGRKNENLYDHLNKVFTKLLLENPRNAYDAFEDYSYNVKFHGYKYSNETDNAKRMKETFEEMKDYEARARQMLDVSFFFFSLEQTNIFFFYQLHRDNILISFLNKEMIY
jgi:hypothetical protein